MTAIKRLFQEGDAILYLAFLWQLPFSWRWILVSNRGIDADRFNEYMDISVYVGEVLIILAFLMFIYNNKYTIKSILFNNIRLNELFHVKQIVILLLVLYLGLNIIKSIDPILSLVSTGHLLLALLFIFLTKILLVSRGTIFLKDIAKVLFFGLILQTFVSGYQFINMQSIGLYWLNESHLSVEFVNVAKAEIFDYKFLRAYGTFPHPNILAAYSLFIWSIFLIYKKLFHVEPLSTTIITSMAFTLILLSGAKTAMFLFGLFYLVSKLKNLFHVKRILMVMASILILVLLTVYSSDIKKSFSTRLEQFRYQSQISQSTLIGSGLGTYRLSYERESSPVEWWLLEPVHNSLYILYREVGILPIAMLSFYILFLLIYVSRGTSTESMLLVVFIFVYLNTDHFFWDINQGIYLMLLSILATYYTIDKNINIYYSLNLKNN